MISCAFVRDHSQSIDEDPPFVAGNFENDRGPVQKIGLSGPSA